jgi:hypothetical protein
MRAAALMLGMLLLLLLQAVEVWRRLREPDALTPRQFWRRIITAAVLEIVLLMWLVGEALVQHQSPLTQLAYWTAALFLGVVGVFSALREMGEVSRRANRSRAELFRGVGSQALDETGRRGDGGNPPDLDRNLRD